jgi:GNAT superfamily N-acetyltransferase
VSSIEIRDLDRGDDGQIRTFWEVVGETVAERPYNTWLAWVAARTYLADPPNDSVTAALCAWDGDTMVGAAAVSAPVTDNLHRSSADYYVLPDRRREGIGTTLLEESMRRVRAWDRRVLATEAFAPIGEESAGLAFARHHGFEQMIEDGIKIADLQTTRDRWPVIAAEAAAYHQDYRLVTTWDPMPEELIEGYCRLNNKFFSLAPTGESDVEDEVWDPARVRERERRGAQARRSDLYTMALDGACDVVGMTELFINETAAHRVFQSGTIVLPEHRGHKLGLAMKAASHQALLERFPDAEWIVTGNADVNAAMNAVNDAFGYRVVERCIEMERTV